MFKDVKILAPAQLRRIQGRAIGSFSRHFRPWTGARDDLLSSEKFFILSAALDGVSSAAFKGSRNGSEEHFLPLLLEIKKSDALVCGIRDFKKE